METKDFALAAYLITIGHKLIEVTKKDEKNIVYFKFEASDAIDTEALKFFSRQALVEPISYSISMKSLKTAMYSIK